MDLGVDGEFVATVVFCDFEKLVISSTATPQKVSDIVVIEFSNFPSKPSWSDTRTVQSLSIDWKKQNIYSISLFDQSVSQLTETANGVHSECTVRMPSKIDFYVSQKSVKTIRLQINQADLIRTLSQSLHQQKE